MRIELSCRVCGFTVSHGPHQTDRAVDPPKPRQAPAPRSPTLPIVTIQKQALQEGLHRLHECIGVYTRYADQYNSMEAPTSYILEMCRTARDLRSSVDDCVLCEVTTMNQIHREHLDTYAAPDQTTGWDGLSLLLERIYHYMRYTYRLRPIHELCELSAKFVPPLLEKIDALAKRDHLSKDEIKGKLMGLSQIGYARLRMVLQALGKVLPKQDERAILVGTLSNTLSTLTQWVSIGPARSAHHKEVCWYVNKVRSETRGLLKVFRSSTTIILELCNYVAGNLFRLDRAHLQISNVEYDRIIPVLRILSDKNPDQTGPLLYNVTQVCGCQNGTCEEVDSHPKTVYLQKWLDCYQNLDSTFEARQDVEKCAELETVLHRAFQGGSTVTTLPPRQVVSDVSRIP